MASGGTATLSHAPFSGLTACTIVVYFYATTDNGGYGRLIGTANSECDLYLTGNYLQWQLDTAGGQSLPTLNLGASAETNWHFVVARYDGATAGVYASGYTEAVNTDGSGAIKATGTTYFGDRSGGTSLFDGDIAYVYIYNRALSDAEISSLERSPFQMFEQAPIWTYYTAPAAGGGGQVISIIMSSTAPLTILLLTGLFCTLRRQHG